MANSTAMIQQKQCSILDWKDGVSLSCENRTEQQLKTIKCPAPRELTKCVSTLYLMMELDLGLPLSNVQQLIANKYKLNQQFILWDFSIL